VVLLCSVFLLLLRCHRCCVPLPPAVMADQQQLNVQTTLMALEEEVDEEMALPPPPPQQQAQPTSAPDGAAAAAAAGAASSTEPAPPSSNPASQPDTATTSTPSLPSSVVIASDQSTTAAATDSPTPTPTPTSTSTPTPASTTTTATASSTSTTASTPSSGTVSAASLLDATTAEEEAQLEREKEQRWTARMKEAERRIVDEPYNHEAWTLLAAEAQSLPMHLARHIYERLLSVFPTAGKYWKQYIDQELANKHYERVEKLFRRCLLTCPFVDLWKTYLAYIRLPRSHSGADKKKDEIVSAFELALQHVSMDIMSTPIWLDYLQYIRSIPAKGSNEEAHKMTELRKVSSHLIASSCSCIVLSLRKKPR